MAPTAAHMRLVYAGQHRAAASPAAPPPSGLVRGAPCLRRPFPHPAPPPRRRRLVSCATVADSSEGRRTRPLSASQVRQQLSGETAELVLGQCRALWPGWDANGCSLLRDDGSLLEGAPSPEQAAAALHVAGSRLLRLRPDQRPATIGRHPVVLGLVESLRVTPPRLPSAAPVSALGAAAAAAAAAPPLGGAGLSAALWSLAVLGGPALFAEEADALCASLPGAEFDRLFQVADTAWGLATARHWTPHLAALERQGALIIERELAAARARDAAGGGGLPGGRPPVSSTQFTSLLWGLAHLGHTPGPLLELIPEAMQLWTSGAAAPPRPGQRPALGGGGQGGITINPTSLCALAWSLAAAGQLATPAGALVLSHVCASGGALLAHAGAKQMMQLHQVALAARQADARAWGALLRGQGPAVQLFAAAELAWIKHAAAPANTTVSAAQADVVAAAAGLGLAVEQEFRVGGLSVDLAVPSVQLAIEVDGPSHFTRNEGSSGEGGVPQRRPTGATLLKRRLLEAQGWAVGHIDTVAWEDLRRPEQKRALLAATVDAALAAAAAAAAGEAPAA